MTLSRPFQAIVAALALFVLVWFVALHRPGSTSTGSGSSSGSSGGQASGAQSAAGATSHAAAPTRSASAAHAATTSHSAGGSHAKGAVAHTAIRARTMTHADHGRRTATTVPATAAHHSAAAAPKQHAARHAQRTAAHTGAAVRRTSPTTHRTSPTTQSGTSGYAAATIADLAHGRTVLLLFWNPRASNDIAVHRQVGIVAHKLGHSVATFSARASQVGLFGSITREVQVYQTPTLLIVNPKRQVTTVTGLTDVYALEQTIREARG